MVGFSERKLLKVAESRGYVTENSVALEIAKLFGFSYMRTALMRMREGKFSMEESFVIASFFEMTPKEYAGVFLNGLFRQVGGHYVCHVDDPDKFIREKKEARKQKEVEAEARKEEREELARQVDELEREV